MKKGVNNLIWALTAVVLIVFSNWFVKDASAASVLNIIGSLIIAKAIMTAFNQGSKKVVFWGYIGVAACLVGVLLNLISLSL